MGPDEHASDEDIIAAVQSGNVAAFAILVRRYEPLVAATVIGMMGPGDDANEVGQETMIKLFRSLDQFNGEAWLSTYLTRIAINTALDALRRRQRDLKRFFFPTHQDDSLAWEDGLPSNADHGRDFEHRQAIDYALQQLSPSYRAVAVLRLVQGYSVDEVAAILGLPKGTVHSRLSRAKAQLTECLKGELGYV